MDKENREFYKREVAQSKADVIFAVDKHHDLVAKLDAKFEKTKFDKFLREYWNVLRHLGVEVESTCERLERLLKKMEAQ